eukprot:jgi/Psemu1/170220/gw1.485.62.1
MRITNQLLVSRIDNLGVVVLNNPRALHALTSDMVDALGDALLHWKRDPTTRAILIKSSPASTKRPVFCSGGDVKSVYHNGMDLYRRKRSETTSATEATTAATAASAATATRPPQDFFFREYRVNHAIAVHPLPIISLWDGLVLGGGVGISIHGRYRVATERTVLAMPECKIGFFPDVGSTWWMTRILPSLPVARYLALTGRKLGPTDCLWAGLATHYVPSDRLGELEEALAKAMVTRSSSSSSNNNHDDAIAGVLASFHQELPTEDCFLATHRSDIEQTFRGTTIDEVLADLEYMEAVCEGECEMQCDLGRRNFRFAVSTLVTLREQSPTSLAVTLEGLRRGAECSESIEDALKQEYRMARAFVATMATMPRGDGEATTGTAGVSDFYEGVRSVLVDKDHAPRWNPPATVTPELVREFFAPI